MIKQKAIVEVDIILYVCIGKAGVCEVRAKGEGEQDHRLINL